MPNPRKTAPFICTSTPDQAIPRMLPDDFTPCHTPQQNILQDAITIGFHGNTLLCADEGLASAAQLATLPQPMQSWLIGHWQGRAVQMALWPNDVALPETLNAIELRASYEHIGEAHWLLAGRASQIATFYRTHQFCGVCGAATRQLSGEAACECTACAHRVWPRVSPAVMVLIRRDTSSQQQLLLARSPHFKPGMYSAVAGFVEPGESLEQCAHREVLEEVGVRICNLRWFGSQSWSFPHSLMLAFVADYQSGDIQCQADEIEDAQWFSYDTLPVLPGHGSIARRLLDAIVQEAIA